MEVVVSIETPTTYMNVLDYNFEQKTMLAFTLQGRVSFTASTLLSIIMIIIRITSSNIDMSKILKE